MSLITDILSKVKSILNTRFESEGTTAVPDIDNTKLTFGNFGLEFDATVLYIDMRKSTLLLSEHNRSTVAKIHMCFFHSVVKIASSLGGDVRSFNGDSLLVFFKVTTKQILSNAVKAAMHIKFVLMNSESSVNDLLNKYSRIDFGIGIDYGTILATKVGISGLNNRDLIWVGNSVNKAVKLSDICNSPNNIAISSYVYGNLIDSVKYHLTKDVWGNKIKTDMWNKALFKFNGELEYYYYTSYYWALV